MTFVFAGAFWDSANILLFLITAFIILLLLFNTLTPFFQNLRLARSHHNRKALQLTIGAPVMYILLAILFNLNPGGVYSSFVLLAMTIVLYYVEVQVYHQLKAKSPRRSRQR